MSFSGDVKEELQKQVPAARHCQLAELAAILHFCGGMAMENGKTLLLIRAENEPVIRKCFTILKKTFNINTSVEEGKTGRNGRLGVFDIRLARQNDILKILQATKYMDGDGKLKELKEPVNSMLIKNACCQRAFLRGVFMSSGSMSDPEKSYHLEIVCTLESQAEQIRSILHSFELEARIVRRKKYFVVYIKDGSGICDFLNIMEAHISLMSFENHRILKEMRNSVNRQVNCETANISKTVNAFSRQAEDIILLREKYGFENLPETLRQMAEVRLEYPDAPLRELGQYLNPPVGKSGVNHRLRKLSELADKIREEAVKGGVL